MNFSLWTFIFTGQNHFSFQVRGHPPVNHEGGTTVVHLVLKRSEAARIQGRAILAGLKVEAREALGENPEQQEERRILAAVEAEPSFLTIKCPECPWLDPFSASRCGAISESPEARQELLRTSPGHRAALETCPLQEAPGEAC